MPGSLCLLQNLPLPLVGAAEIVQRQPNHLSDLNGLSASRVGALPSIQDVQDALQKPPAE